MKAIASLILLIASPAVLASGIDGTWDINTNNSSFGTVAFSGNGTVGILSIESYNDGLIDIQVTPAGVQYSTLYVTFVRTGTYYQLYQGVVSSDGCLMTGHLINLSGPIGVPDRFPFTAKKQGCP